jgi:YHS domain-containing protein
MTGWVLRIILLFVIIWVILRFLGGIIDGLSGGQMRGRSRGRHRSGRGDGGSGNAGAASVPLVRDPVCGTFVVRAKALTVGSGDQTQYFCSEKCRDEFARRA